ncbi:hypothetical protein LMTR3_20140 [Bradyrhizobium sp. LMTR 3]|nr:hypothetical protein LMTR3_20140 [Bradyrhizobium sp. LMTR 3]
MGNNAILVHSVSLHAKAAELVVQLVELDCSETLCFSACLLDRLFPGEGDGRMPWPAYSAR